MRFERRGGPPDLQSAFKALVLGHLAGRALDDNQAKEALAGQFPDFACFRDIVLIEMKHLETDQSDRLNDVLDAKIDPAEMPFFYGEREAHFITDAVKNGPAINEEIFGKLSLTIKRILRNANAQLASYRVRHPRKNSVNICVILNSRLQEFTPDVVIDAVHQRMKPGRPGKALYPEIDIVLYFSEKHFQILPNGQVAYPIASYIGVGAVYQPWKMQFADRIVDDWSHLRTGGPAKQDGDLNGFETVSDVPESMARSEFWQLEYRRNPYLSTMPVDRLRAHFHRTMAVNSLTLLKGSWPKPSRHEASESLRIFQHVLEETNRRGLDMRLFDPRHLSATEKAQIYIGLPDELVQILTRDSGATRRAG